MDAKIVFNGRRPLFILAEATNWMQKTMPDELPGFAACFGSTGPVARACWDG
jgi:hypothetical protein